MRSREEIETGYIKTEYLVGHDEPIRSQHIPVEIELLLDIRDLLNKAW